VREIVPELERLVASGERIVLAVLVSAWRSAPRPVGSAMAIGSRGTIVGSLTGGCVEAELALAAQDVLASGSTELRSFGIEDERACAVGLPCGGEIEVLLVEASPELVAEVADAVRSEQRLDLRVDLARNELAVVPSEPELAERVVRVELGRRGQLVVVGAPELAEALCAAARLLSWRTVVIEPRPALATAERVPSADELRVGWPEEELPQLALDERSAVVVLTHEERLDVPALAQALASAAGYVGALGSRRTQERRRQSLRELGIADETLARLHGPAGLDIGAGTPAEMALSILAEIVAVRSGHDGGSLRTGDGPIHGRASHSERVTA
jgi:xanthine dehydrogenase accessory factor